MKLLEVTWHDMKLKLTVGCSLINEIGQWFHQLGGVTFSEIVI